MDMKELKTFVVLTEVLNYQRAAELLDYAPSTLAHHIQVIEEEMGGPFFVKRGRQLSLTKRGKVFLPYANEMLALYQTAAENLSGRGGVSKIAVGGSEASTNFCFGELFSRFTESMSSVRLKLFGGPNSATPSLVEQDTAELGYYYSFDLERIPGISDVPLFREMNCLICSAENPLATGERWRYEDFGGARFAFPHDDCLSAVDILEKLKSRGVQPGRVSYPGCMSAVIELAHRENALMCLPYSAAKRLVRQNAMVILGLDEDPVWMYARVLYKDASKLSAPARKLLEVSRKYAIQCVENEPEKYLVP